ncbi:ABC transporter permease subunit [Pokkaliibacter sp. MBI-7]|uniref:ABC transporter permease subunit n=1 Tax=Pokkaliibacter sp. MBI-7 TaxID=3040600 RepID=UPI00244725BA|nr:ABC transporter permease subunit [Pokkaliibacter sp. MBI-7]MDH2433206.1 ABC transporter permease subunit [Pokkaliibacter sp. MBI-7]
MNARVPVDAPELDFDTPALRRHRRIRALKDRLASGMIGIGGISVIMAVLLICVYLIYEVLPLFERASIRPWQTAQQLSSAYVLADVKGSPLYITTEEQAEIGMEVTDAGEVVFFDAASGKIVQRHALPLPANTHITSFAEPAARGDTFAVGLSDGSALVLRDDYQVTYPSDQRLITPQLSFPFGDTPLQVQSDGQPLNYLALRDSDDALMLVGGHDANLAAVRFDKQTNLLTNEVSLTPTRFSLPQSNHRVLQVLILPGMQWIVAGEENGGLSVFDLRKADKPILSEQLSASKGDITRMTLLLGGQSVLVGDDQGTVSQWFLVRGEKKEWHLQRIRAFSRQGYKVDWIAPEQGRKGFAVAYDDGMVSLYNATAETNSVNRRLFEQSEPLLLGYAPRGNALLTVNSQHQLQLWSVDNEHPEVSWRSLWGKVWYEGYDHPDYIWQSSSAANDFEPKFSLTPLAFGTLKAALYAMLLATPLAICGAIYTAYFMAGGLRRKVKPLIELMEALPTVILGFFAGLFLAPFVEGHLPFIAMALVLIPVGVLLFAFAWAQLPGAIRHRLPEGFDALLLVPLILLLGWLCLSLSEPVELALFGGDARAFLTNQLGIDFDQRNALVVGLAMGFAVIPTIFSITEDAIFGVPRSLTYGSLALGATPWQTLVRVVLPTASPGIFSALMIGLGRAVGETMIVLMATGNTPIMDANIFEGMRTLAANIAVEMPESEVGSSHFRILFLAALVLFAFTFVMNTGAELIRQRLRKKYGSL